MSWMGKILGGGLGFVFGGPIGAVFGAALGHQAFDADSRSGTLSGLENKQGIYFAATFSMLGKLAKADGKVSQQEVDVIDRIMRDNLRLPEDARKLAIISLTQQKMLTMRSRIMRNSFMMSLVARKSCWFRLSICCSLLLMPMASYTHQKKP